MAKTKSKPEPKKASPKAADPKADSKADSKAGAKADSKHRSPAPAVPGAALGIDFGGTGLKAALVDVATGELLSQRHRINTPKPSTPEAVAEALVHLVSLVAAERELPVDLPVGIGIPGPIKDGLVTNAANIDKRWAGTNGEKLLSRALGRRVFAINDADAAGLAEIRFGAGRDVPGTVLLLTLGTGIGSGLFVDGRLVPNVEVGHLEWRGRVVEARLSGVARERRHVRWRAWATEFSAWLLRIQLYFWPDLIILGGGVSKEMKKYQKWLKSPVPIKTARFLNTSGIIGAAMYASERVRAEAARPVRLVPANKRKTAS
jgi:polyphosphate glucokinase